MSNLKATINTMECFKNYVKLSVALRIEKCIREVISGITYQSNNIGQVLAS